MVLTIFVFLYVLEKQLSSQIENTNAVEFTSKDVIEVENSLSDILNLQESKESEVT